jgi:hypothetical protein
MRREEAGESVYNTWIHGTFHDFMTWLSAPTLQPHSHVSDSY